MGGVFIVLIGGLVPLSGVRLSMMFYLKLYIESKTNTQAIIKQKTTVLDQQHYS
jgi:hypothetical protein